MWVDALHLNGGAAFALHPIMDTCCLSNAELPTFLVFLMINNAYSSGNLVLQMDSV